MSAIRKRHEDFAAEVGKTFKRRTKAIAYRGARVDCVPVKEIVDGKLSDRGRTDVSITYRVNGARIQLRLHVWGDRWVWVDVRRISKHGWTWAYTAEGRFLSSNGARALVDRVAKTMDATWNAESQVPNSLAEIWSKCLAVGPRSLQ